MKLVLITYDFSQEMYCLYAKTKCFVLGVRSKKVTEENYSFGMKFKVTDGEVVFVLFTLCSIIGVQDASRHCGQQGWKCFCRRCKHQLCDQVRA